MRKERENVYVFEMHIKRPPVWDLIMNPAREKSFEMFTQLTAAVLIAQII